MGRYRSGQTGRTVNPLAYAFVGSNPTLPTPALQFSCSDRLGNYRPLRDFPPALRPDWEEDLPPPLDFDERPGDFACTVTERVALLFPARLPPPLLPPRLRPLLFPPEERPPLDLEPRELLLLEPPELFPLDLPPREPPELDFFELDDFETELLLLPPDDFLPPDFFPPEDFPPEDRLLEDERLDLEVFEPLRLEEEDFLPLDELLFELPPPDDLLPDDLALPLL